MLTRSFGGCAGDQGKIVDDSTIVTIPGKQKRKDARRVDRVFPLRVKWFESRDCAAARTGS